MRSVIVAAFIVGAAGVARANEVQDVTCQGAVTFPPDGMTNVALGTIAQVRDEGLRCRISFVDDLGRAVRFQRDDQDPWTLRPSLEAGRRYTLEVLEPNGDALAECDGYERRVTFETRPAPHLREVRFSSSGAGINQVDVAFSEDILNPQDFERTRGLFSVDAVGGGPLDLRPDGEFNSPAGTSLFGRVDSGQGIRVHVSKGFRFASGASMAADFDETIIPASFPFGWRPEGAMQPCPEPASDGCAHVPGGLLALLIAARALRRSTRR